MQMEAVIQRGLQRRMTRKGQAEMTGEDEVIHLSLIMPATRRAGGGVLSVLAKVSLLHQQRIMTHDIGTELLFIYSLQKRSPFSDNPLC